MTTEQAEQLIQAVRNIDIDIGISFVSALVLIAVLWITKRKD